jgi:hypothetical protein
MRTILALAVVTCLLQTGRGWAQGNDQGPGAGGAILRDPFAPPPKQAVPAVPPTYVESLINKNSPGTAGAVPAQGKLAEKMAEYAASTDNHFNDDYKIKPTDEPYVIFIQCYVGDDCHKLARQMVEELRNSYHLRAYTFNKGAKEKHEEYARVMEEIQKRKEIIVKNHGSPDVPIRVGYINIQEQCAVILGGYTSMEAAKRDLDQRIRNLKELDPKKVSLDKQIVYDEERQAKAFEPKIKKSEYVNPFKTTAFVGHNPTIEQRRPADWDQLDIGLLKKLNAGEPYSLLDNKKKFTLAVKNFPTPTIVQSQATSKGFMENVFGEKSGPRRDSAAGAATSLTEWLRKGNIEAYVLHTKYTSIVSVGSFDSKDDPRLRTMAQMMETQVLPQMTRYFPPLPNQPHSQMMPMEIPH